MGTIYCIRSQVNGGVYIGQTTLPVEKRWAVHRTGLNTNSHYSKHMQHAWNKYGEEQFEFSVIEVCPNNMLDIREIAWIAYYKATNPDYGYNFRSGGKVARGYKLPDETRQRMSKAKTGVKRGKFSPQHRKNMSVGMSGKKHTYPKNKKPVTAETLINMSNAQRGRICSAETRAKIADALRGRTRPNSIAVKGLATKLANKVKNS